jgi:hypothetical protein
MHSLQSWAPPDCCHGRQVTEQYVRFTRGASGFVVKLRKRGANGCLENSPVQMLQYRVTSKQLISTHNTWVTGVEMITECQSRLRFQSCALNLRERFINTLRGFV